jgi:hypothetical protein
MPQGALRGRGFSSVDAGAELAVRKRDSNGVGSGGKDLSPGACTWADREGHGRRENLVLVWQAAHL